MKGGEYLLLSVIDTIRALSELIESKYPDYPVCDMDIDEDYPRPSYFIDVEDVATSFVATDYIKESSTIKIVFFANDRYEGFLELLDTIYKCFLLSSFTYFLEVFPSVPQLILKL